MGLEKKLDNIWISNTKIHVNRPKYQKNTILPKPMGWTNKVVGEAIRRELSRYNCNNIEC